jgi:HEAT repeat protein
VVADDAAPLRQTINATLVAATADEDARVRYAAYSALKDEARTDAIAEAFRRGLEDEDVNIRLLALNKLVAFEGASDEVVRQLLSALRDPGMAGHARNLLIDMGTPAAGSLIELLQSDETSLQIMVLDILGRIPLADHQESAVAQITAVLKSGDREVRIAAIEALDRMADPPSQEPELDQRYVHYAKALVRKYDVNEDGVLTAEEWRGMSTEMRNNARVADTNGDGRLTPVELALYLQRR